ncbi:hypothetical protein SEVIR_7G023757v4 [Setaria viridis]
MRYFRCRGLWHLARDCKRPCSPISSVSSGDGGDAGWFARVTPFRQHRGVCKLMGAHPPQRPSVTIVHGVDTPTVQGGMPHREASHSNCSRGRRSSPPHQDRNLPRHPFGKGHQVHRAMMVWNLGRIRTSSMMRILFLATPRLARRRRRASSPMTRRWMPKKAGCSWHF